VVRRQLRVRHVHLDVSYETALTRVAADPTRGLSRDPAFLQSAHDRFRELRPTLPRPDLAFDSESADATTIADEIATALATSP
jgi:hypothetical protein